MPSPVYLDYNASTPLDGAVLEAMLPYLAMYYGNPSSPHDDGRRARQAIDTARQQVAAAVGAHPTEVIFTSGGREANNLFLKGAAAAFKTPGGLAISAIEHPCVGNAALQLARQGWRQVTLPVDGAGRVTSAGVAAALAQKPALWSVMLANNETGVVQDVEAIARQVAAGSNAASPGWFHTDAAQAFGKIPLDFRALNAAGVHALTLSAHKIYGPKGAAALVVDKRLDLAPLIAGGGQERGLRSGTENVAAIVGFGVAAELAASRLTSFTDHLLPLQARLEAGVTGMGATLFGAAAARLPNTSYFAFDGVDGDILLGRLNQAGFAVASGAACSSVQPASSPVLAAMGVPEPLARGAVRVSLGAGTTDEEIDNFLLALEAILYNLQKLTALQFDFEDDGSAAPTEF
jgi:cysteine desulfurase